ncbi:MAG: hypothetical protein QOH72_5187 [Solirubrobacteraceae bacterium]|nr:hypothetical protein [Solirubrobacteraceae bacterium]
MRNRQLHAALSAFAEEAAWQLSSDTSEGADLPFEVVAAGRRDSPLYCYRPLTADFISERVSLLGRLPTYLPALAALCDLGGLDAYLEARGEAAPRDPRERAESTLRTFLGRVFEDSSDFVLDPSRLKRALHELEAALYEGRSETVVIAPLLGLEIASPEIALGDGLSLVNGDTFPEDAPAEAVWAAGAPRAHLLAVLRWEAAAGDAAPVAHARVRLRRLLTALRLYEAGSFAYGPLAWTRTGGGTWQPFALGTLGHRTEASLCVSVDQEDELRAFCSLVARRTPRSGEVAWALRRFEMGCERSVPAEALSDHLLALRGLLEPEGPASGRLGGRVAALCATEEERAALAERVAHTAALERPVVAGLAVDPAIDRLVEDLAGHLRALLRDVLCGHLDADLRGVADEILAEAVRDAVRKADAERAAELEARAQLRARAEAEAAGEQNGGYEPGFVRFAEP